MPTKPRSHRPRSADVRKTHVGGGKNPYDRRWRKCRRAFLHRNPACSADGCDHPASEVDHITPITEGGSVLDFANLQALCKSCHSKKTRRDQRQKTHPDE